MAVIKMQHPERRQRVLTDADVEAIAMKLQKRVVQEFYKDLGKSVFGFVWKAAVLALLGLVGATTMKGNLP